MEESEEKQNLHHFLQFGIYLSAALDTLMFVYAEKVTHLREAMDDIECFTIRKEDIPHWLLNAE